MSKLKGYLEEFESGERKFIPAVVGYFIDGDKVLLGLRKSSSTNLGLNLVAGIGGKQGDMAGLEDETEEEAFVREAIEEIGIKPIKFENRGRVKFIFPGNPKWCQEVEVFICTEWEGEPSETKDIAPAWYPINEIPFNQMWKDNAEWLPQVLAGGRVNAVFLFDEKWEIAERKFIEQ